MKSRLIELLTCFLSTHFLLVLATSKFSLSRSRRQAWSYNQDWSPSPYYYHHHNTPSWVRLPRSNAEDATTTTSTQIRWETPKESKFVFDQKSGRSLELRPRKSKLSSYWSESEPDTEQRAINSHKSSEKKQVDNQSGRLFSSESIQKFTETLGAINTVGRYLVNMTRSYNEDSSEEEEPDEKDEKPSEDVPGAIYTISKNVLGRNVTDTIAPIVRQFPLVTLNTGKVVVDNGRSCLTPDGGHGECDDLSSCPELLLDLANLRQSICFKSLFVPGVCCPKNNQEGSVVNRPTNPPLQQTTTRRPFVGTTIRTTVRPFSSTLLPPLMVDSRDCGEQEIPGFRVVGGTESTPGQWPWMAAIFLHGNKRTEFWCGGSLIGKRHILTAAHCTRDTRQKPFNPRQFTVRLGDIDLRKDDEPSNPETYNVVEIKAHPRFSRVGFYNDIAILILDRDVRKSKYVIPLCLPEEHLSEKFTNQRPTVVGWGTTYYGGKESAIQRQAELPVWRNEDCDQAYFQPINENFICAGYTDGGKDACQGDSGGPLMLRKDNRWMQIGIVSFGNKCGEPGYPGVYTRVTQYLDWIKQNMQIT